METRVKERYVAPTFIVIEILPEGILCASNEGVGEEEGNGSFN